METPLSENLDLEKLPESTKLQLAHLLPTKLRYQYLYWHHRKKAEEHIRKVWEYDDKLRGLREEAND